jgi:hypothetical protein
MIGIGVEPVRLVGHDHGQPEDLAKGTDNLPSLRSDSVSEQNHRIKRNSNINFRSNDQS